jgi:hypothetical protein
MAFPIRSPRKIYRVTGMTSNVDNAPGIDNLPGGTETDTTKPLYVKMKKSVGDWLGLTPLASNDPIFIGTFAGEGLNKGTTYRKKIGGFKSGSYTLIAATIFTVNEIVVNSETGAITTPTKKVKTISIGFPAGHSVNEFIAWISSTTRASEITAIRGPSGARTDLSVSA